MMKFLVAALMALNMAGQAQAQAQAKCADIAKRDGKVDIEDLLMVLGAYGKKSAAANLVGDTNINIEDLLALLGQYGKSCRNGPPPPPPGTCRQSRSTPGSATYWRYRCGLIIAEVAEGSSYNKYIEIYNPTSGTIQLDKGYAFPNSNNGDKDGKIDTADYWNTFKKGAKIKSKGIYTICHTKADAKIRKSCDQFHNYLSNGDDGYCLVYGTKAKHAHIDCVGDWGKDPGSGWNVCGVKAATMDKTLVRKCAVRHGNQNVGHFAGWKASAGTNAKNCEWTVKPKNYWDAKGFHKTCPPPPPPPPRRWSNVFKNGGFEDDKRKEGYKYMTPKGWKGKNVVIVKSGNKPWGGMKAPNHGRGSNNYFLSIQGKGAFVEQSIKTKKGLTYMVRFQATHRPGYGNDELLVVKINGATEWRTNHPGDKFTQYVFSFVAKTTSATVRFENDSPKGDKSVFVDDVWIHDYHKQEKCVESYKASKVNKGTVSGQKGEYNGVCAIGYCLSHAGKFKNHGKKAAKSCAVNSYSCATCCNKDTHCKAFHFATTQQGAFSTPITNCELYSSLDTSAANIVDWENTHTCSKAAATAWKKTHSSKCQVSQYRRSEACVRIPAANTKCPKNHFVMDEGVSGWWQRGKGGVHIKSFRGTLDDYQAQYPQCDQFAVNKLLLQFSGTAQVTCKANAKLITSYAKKDKNWYRKFKCSKDSKGQTYCQCPKDASGHVQQPAVCSGNGSCKNDVSKFGEFKLWGPGRDAKKRKLIKHVKGFPVVVDWKRHPVYEFKVPKGTLIRDLGYFEIKANSWAAGAKVEHLVIDASGTMLSKKQLSGERLVNGDFTADATGGYKYMAPKGWKTNGGGTVVVKSKNGPWGGLASARGTYFLSIQGAGRYIEQRIKTNKGKTYKVNFWATHRPGYGNDETLVVKIDSKIAFSRNKMKDEFSLYSFTFKATGTSHLFRWENDSPKGDKSVFVDNLQIGNM